MLGVGKTKATEAFPYAITLVISARACKAEVPLLLVERVDMAAIGALVKVTVEVNVLLEVDEDVVLELFKGKVGGGPGVACGTPTVVEEDDALKNEVKRDDEG